MSGLRPHPLPDPLVDLVAQRFRALGEPVRIRIVERLIRDDATVQELTDELGCSQQNVSKHLRVLQQSGMVTRKKEGTYSRYSLADESVPDLCDLVCGSVQRQLFELNELVGGPQ